MERFSRTELLLGKSKLEKLHRASVAIIGVGAVGGYCLEGLARAGVGNFILVDFDEIRPSNINRQILATERTIGQRKVDLAKDRVLSINPNANVHTFPIFADEVSIQEVLALKPDMVVDAIDALNPKIQVMKAVYEKGIPLVSSMGAATRTDPSRIKTADIFDTKVCPLAARIRHRLKEQGVGRGIRCVYSDEQQDVHALSEPPDPHPNDYTRGRPRRQLGSLPTVTGIFGLVLANMAIETIVGGFSK